MSPDKLSSIFDIARQSFSRFPVVLSGEKSWCLEKLLSCPNIQMSDNSIFVSSQDSLKGFTSIPSNNVKTLLGSDCSLLVWDGFSGFNPDALGAASGLIRGGGLLIFIVPPIHQLIKRPDPDYQRMCATEDEMTLVNTYFLKRLAYFFESKPCLLFTQASETQTSIPSLKRQSSRPTLPSSDQQEAISLILHVVSGHRRRPLVITADRGRGKSSALGIAAAKLVLKNKRKILISAPSKKACVKAFQHFSEYISGQGFEPNNYSEYLEFIPPDELLEHKPTCQLLMIDEAAGIPAPLLSELLSHYSRVVFSSTIHGYEGNGQGFAIRFKKQLELQTPHWKGIHLSQPVRWADNDPLEKWLSQLLFLTLNDFSLVAAEGSRLSIDALQIKWLTQDELSTNATLLEQIISLLVNAHYQTSPDDIRLILDHPGIHLACGFSKVPTVTGKTELVSAMLLIEEGRIQDEDLLLSILNGKRRLRGHLVPQSLATYTGNQAYLENSSLRVMRIAVKPEYENQGVGTQLLDSAHKYAIKNNFYYLSTAFGLTPELLSFWRKSHFSLLKLGIQKDNASACYTAVMLRALSTEAKELESQQIISQQLFNGCSRQYRNHSTTSLKEAIVATQFSDTEVYLEFRQLAQLKRYAHANLALEDCMNELIKLLFLSFSENKIVVLEEEIQLLLIKRILQARSVSTCVKDFKLTGKKELDKVLRKGVATLLEQVER